MTFRRRHLRRRLRRLDAAWRRQLRGPQTTLRVAERRARLRRQKRRAVTWKSELALGVAFAACLAGALTGNFAFAMAATGFVIFGGVLAVRSVRLVLLERRDWAEIHQAQEEIALLQQRHAQERQTV